MKEFFESASVLSPLLLWPSLDVKKTNFHARIKYFFLNNPQSDCARLSFKALQALQVLIRKFAANEFSW